MITFTHVATVENPLREEWGIHKAKTDFLINHSCVFKDWTHFHPDWEYSPRAEEFHKLIRVTETKPTVEVVDGWYKVTSIRVTMEYDYYTDDERFN